MASRVTKKNSDTSDTKKQARLWSFTSFYDVPPVFDEDIMKYLCYGVEICPRTNRKHFQCFVIFNRSQRFNFVKKTFGDKVHLEISKGTAEQNVKYCSKGSLKSEDSDEYVNPEFYEFGELTSQGKRVDLVQLVQSNSSWQACALSRPDVFIKYNNGIKSYYQAKGVDYIISGHKPTVIWYYGKSGAGKTRQIMSKMKEFHSQGLRLWRRPLGSDAWFDGFAGQDVAFLEEIRSSTYKFDDLLQLLDYDCPQVPIKGGFTDFRPKYILITSSMSPDTMYSGVGEAIKQLTRRIDESVDFGSEPEAKPKDDFDDFFTSYSA